MQTVTFETYQFNELDDKAKEKAREWYREGNDDMTWQAESTVDDFKAIAKLIGIEVKDVFYSGFSSQGDGACFTGTYEYKSDALKAVKDYATDEALFAIVKSIELSGKDIRVDMSHRGRYYHNNSIDFDFLNEGTCLEDEEAVKEALKDLMTWLYRNLEKDYDYVNSNEAIDDNIINNEYNFTKEGSRKVVL